MLWRRTSWVTIASALFGVTIRVNCAVFTRQYTVRRQIMLVTEQKQCNDCFYNWKWADCLIPLSLVTLQLRLIGGTHKKSHSCIETSWLEYCMPWHCNPIYFLRKEMISDYQLLPLAFPASAHFSTLHREICEWKTQWWSCCSLELAVVMPGVSTGWRWSRIQECWNCAQGSIQFWFGIGSPRCQLCNLLDMKQAASSSTL